MNDRSSMVKRMARLKQIVTLVLFSTAILGCRTCSPATAKKTDEIVSPATEVGTPAGDAVTLSVGPEGGILASADDRFVLAIPENAVKEPVTFSIQPITNTATDGIGSAYRLGPSGYRFEKPLLISFKYDDSQLGEFPPDMCLIAYQDDQHAWRSIDTAYIDENDKIFTALTTHFSDIGFQKYRGGRDLRADPPKPKEKVNPFQQQFHLTPEKATIYLGESVSIQLTGCEKPGLLKQLNDRLFYSSARTCWYGNGAGHLQGPTYWIRPRVGNLTSDYGTETTIYKSHLHDRPGVVKVFAGAKFVPEDESEVLNTILGVTEITILDRGYRASGQDGRVSYSGLVCDLEKPFSIATVMGPVSFSTNFTPSKRDAGTASWGATYGAFGSGSGPYWIEEQGDGYQILVQLSSKVSLAGRQSVGSGAAHITLTRLTGDECRAERK